MAKKGNRIQVILECTEHKTSGMPGTHVISLLRIKRTLQIEWKLKIQSYLEENDSSQRN